MDRPRILRGARIASRAVGDASALRDPRSAQLIGNGWISLLKQKAYFARTEFHFTAKRAKSGAN
jgi:hypothetical protein